MANPENLRPPSTSEARERGRKGGKASAKSKREKKDLLGWLNYLLQQDMPPDESGEVRTWAEGIAASLLLQGEKGNVQAIKEIFDRIHGKEQKIDLTSSDGSMATPSEVILKLVKADAEKDA